MKSKDNEENLSPFLRNPLRIKLYLTYSRRDSFPSYLLLASDRTPPIFMWVVCGPMSAVPPPGGTLLALKQSHRLLRTFHGPPSTERYPPSTLFLSRSATAGSSISHLGTPQTRGEAPCHVWSGAVTARTLPLYPFGPKMIHGILPPPASLSALFPFTHP